MPAPTVISVSDVSKRFVINKEKSLKERVLNFRNRHYGREDFWALNGVSLDVAAGETVGLIGANGSGKSTLLKTIGGIIEPTGGSVAVRGRIAALLELGAGFHPDLTGRDNVYLNAAILGLTTKETDRHFEDIVEFSGIREFIDTQVKFYSSGMYVRLAFAVAVHVDPEILLVDEVLAVGDEPFQRKCMDKIRSFQHEGRTIVLVTHSADAVGEVCDRAVVLKHGVVQFDGETGEGIRVLRDGFTQERTVEAERNPAQPFIRGVRLLDSAGKPVEVIRAGSDLVLEVDVTAPETVRSWRTGMAFDTPLGQSIFGTNTVQIGQPQGDLLGDATVRWRFTAPRLGHGEYFVRISLGGDEIGTVVLQERAARFSIDEAPTYSGIVSIPTTLEIER